MNRSPAATRDDIEDVLGVLNIFMNKTDTALGEQRANILKIMNNLDAMSKRQEISDNERLVMGHQLERLDRWVHELADKIGHKLRL